MNYYFEVLKKYAVFSGRARRKEFWTFHIFNVLFFLVLVYIEGETGINYGNDIGPLVIFFLLAILIPTIAVGVRRMHDVNKSGWYFFVPFYNFMLACADGTEGNKYGPNPDERPTGGSLGGY